MKRGVFVQTDPSLKVYIEHTLDRERKDPNQEIYLNKAADQSLDATHLFLSTPGRALNSEMVNNGLSALVTSWISKNSFVEVVATNDDDASDFAPEFGNDSGSD